MVVDNYATNYDIYATDGGGSCTHVNYEDGSFQHTYWQGYIHGALVQQHEPSFVKFGPDGSCYATHHDGIIQIWDSINASYSFNLQNIIKFSDYWIVDASWSPKW